MNIPNDDKEDMVIKTVIAVILLAFILLMFLSGIVCMMKVNEQVRRHEDATNSTSRRP